MAECFLLASHFLDSALWGARFISDDPIVRHGRTSLATAQAQSTLATLSLSLTLRLRALASECGGGTTRIAAPPPGGAPHPAIYSLILLTCVSLQPARLILHRHQLSTVSNEVGFSLTCMYSFPAPLSADLYRGSNNDDRCRDETVAPLNTYTFLKHEHEPNECVNLL